MVFFKHFAILALTVGAIANPLAQGEDIHESSPCDVVRCAEGTECKVVSDRAVCVPLEPQECGPTTCERGDVCCNDSCGICTPPGGFCTMQLCAPTGPKCGPKQCYEGEECCNESCGTCVKPGKGCTKQFCPRDEPKPEPIQCGQNTCDAESEYCCNESCGTCAAIGGGCTKQFCLPEPIQCGKNTCDPESEYCCNESCGTCAAKDGGGCTEQFCLPDPQGDKCGLNTCEKGEVCCNQSCGICAPPDAACIDLFCESEAVQAPEATPAPEPEEEVKCGDNICEKGTVCCNASCGVCLPPDMACIQIACA